MTRRPGERTHIPCVACGDEIRFYTNQTCGKPECRAELILHPEIRRTKPPTARNKRPWKKSYRPPDLSTIMSTLEIPVGEDAIEPLVLGALELSRRANWGTDYRIEDERGANVKVAQNSVWGWLSRVSVMLKIQAEHSGEPSLIVRKKKTCSVKVTVRKSLGLTMPDLCDVFMAWRCPCPEDHKVYYKSINDLPSQVGYHDACPRCGAAPLEVINV